MIVFSSNGEARGYDTFTSITAATSFTAAKISPSADAGTVGNKCRAVLITVESGSINFTIDGTTPTATAGTNIGHTLNAGDSMVISSFENVKRFLMINSEDSNGVVVKATYMF